LSDQLDAAAAPANEASPPEATSSEGAGGPPQPVGLGPSLGELVLQAGSPVDEDIPVASSSSSLPSGLPPAPPPAEPPPPPAEWLPESFTMLPEAVEASLGSGAVNLPRGEGSGGECGEGEQEGAVEGAEGCRVYISEDVEESGPGGARARSGTGGTGCKGAETRLGSSASCSSPRGSGRRADGIHAESPRSIASGNSERSNCDRTLDCGVGQDTSCATLDARYEVLQVDISVIDKASNNSNINSNMATNSNGTSQKRSEQGSLIWPTSNLPLREALKTPLGKMMAFLFALACIILLPLLFLVAMAFFIKLEM